VGYGGADAGSAALRMSMSLQALNGLLDGWEGEGRWVVR